MLNDNFTNLERGCRRNRSRRLCFQEMIKYTKILKNFFNLSTIIFSLVKRKSEGDDGYGQAPTRGRTMGKTARKTANRKNRKAENELETMKSWTETLKNSYESQN